MYKIGDFSKKVSIPVKTLRYYDEINLFKPSYIDDFTGYRYYTDEQIEQIKKSLQDYYAEHLSEMPDTNGSKACKSIAELQDGGYLPLDIKNPKTNDVFAPTTEACVKKTGDQKFEYEVNE